MRHDTVRTRYGGVRRTEVAQRQSTTQMKWRSKVRVLPSVQIRWRERLGLDGCPYVVRWRLETRWGSVRVHHWLGPDDDRAFHDHPWWFTTVVLRGGYADHSPEGVEHLRAPAIRHRTATHRHTVVPDPGGAWTLVLTGPRIRAWGFWADGVRFVKANKWFASRGHHPCD